MRRPLLLLVLAGLFCVPAAAQISPPDPLATRLVLTPTARPMPPGHVALGSHAVVLPHASVGLHTRLSVTGGVSALPLVDDHLGYLAAKWVVHTDGDRSVAVGGLVMTDVFGSSRESWLDLTPDEPAAVFYAVTTLGPPTRAVTFGVYTLPIFWQLGALVGFERELGPGLKWVSENHIVDLIDTEFITSQGLRFYGRRLAIDLGVVAVPTEWSDNTAIGPYLSVAYNFGPR
ncbi:MAG: hypothetical protein AAF970_18575 [Bacteroidota bacterium]